MDIAWWLKRIGATSLIGVLFAILRLFFLPGAHNQRKKLGYYIANMGKVPKEFPTIEPETRLSERVIRINGMNPGSFTLQGSNTYLLGTGSNRILIDSADGKSAFIKKIKAVLEREDATIEHILITHGHWDHIGGIPALRREFPDALVWKHLNSSKEMDPSGYPYDGVLENGTVISVKGATLRSILTPGHCPDHVALILEEEGSVFTGDCVLGNGTAVFDDLHQYVGSLRILLREVSSVKSGVLLPGNASTTAGRLYPGHGVMIHNGEEKITGYIEHRQVREDQILKCLENSKWPKKIPAIVSIVYADQKLNWVLTRAAKHNVAQHLEKLKREGKVQRHHDLWSIVGQHQHVE